MTFERLSEQPAKKSTPPIPQKRSKSFQLCMKNQRRTISHRYHPIEAGVPHGSVLGPTLYIIYTVDIPTGLQQHRPSEMIP
ncbi:uncharacterized protein LOC117186123 isoform X1 [Drosophila miranda]|uniref:uncharacterized protein LOC117186123 isoform X1 n=1 Tax=Drosophila miranda TaxID=7229 RepID=UPI00143F85CB|nr:uncharacterized protein LOC117186123 isoform X1 [Drosophila miranda]XP_033242149.1 uncharacterized protein LOC117186123 isoform X1 [Drosophila miranda]XP_033242150.1 uncharacterized protein LOC117186123 isoform X1 [Drosophila miranda]XP_033242151.1 uncharacterized protein LOC117186123 isoform X1 [Drosophila miranda]